MPKRRTTPKLDHRGKETPLQRAHRLKKKPTNVIWDEEIMLGAFCDRIAEGNLIVSTAREFGATPRIIETWCEKYPDFADSLNKARRIGAEALLEKARNAQEEAKIWAKRRGTSATSFVIACNNLAHQYKWEASKLRPAEYGERIQQDLTITPLSGAKRVSMRDRIAAAAVTTTPSEEGDSTE